MDVLRLTREALELDRRGNCCMIFWYPSLLTNITPIALGSQYGMCVSQEPPNEVLQLLQDDERGVGMMRMVAA